MARSSSWPKPKLQHAFMQVVAVWAATCVFAPIVAVNGRVAAQPASNVRNTAGVNGGTAEKSLPTNGGCTTDAGAAMLNNLGSLGPSGSDTESAGLFSTDLSHALTAFPGDTARFGNATQWSVACTLAGSWQLGYAQGRAFELTLPGTTARWLGAQTGGDAGEFSPGQTVQLSAFEQRLETNRFRLEYAWSGMLGGWRVSGKAAVDALTADRFNRLYGGGTGVKEPGGALDTTFLYNELIADGIGSGVAASALLQLTPPHSNLQVKLQAAPLWGQIHWGRAAWRTLVLDTARTPTPEGLAPLVQGVQHEAPLTLALAPTFGAAVRVPVAWKGAGYWDVGVAAAGPRVWASAHVGGERALGPGRIEWRVGRDQNLASVTEPVAGVSYGQTPPVTGWTFGVGWTFGGSAAGGREGAGDPSKGGILAPFGFDVGATLDDRGHLSALSGDFGVSIRW